MEDFGPIETHQDADMNKDFNHWIPRYHKPDTPCDYCKSRQLDCFYTFDGQKCCSPCNALFRPCSFEGSHKIQQNPKSRRSRPTTLDTLHVVEEDVPQEWGSLIGTKPMKMLGSKQEEMDEDADRSAKKGARFARAAVVIMRSWINEHSDHPYPTEEEKEELKIRTGLTGSQITNWLANARRRDKDRKKKRSAPSSIRPSVEAIDIPTGRTWEDLNPFERWQHSPPENEPAPLEAIADAVRESTPLESASSSTSASAHQNDSSNSSLNFSLFRAPSSASLETGWSTLSSRSVDSKGSAFSHGSKNSFGSFNSFGSGGKLKERRRRRNARPHPKVDVHGKDRPFQCTFCTDTFKSKYDWTRHEKSLHLSLEKWMCAPLGPEVTDVITGRKLCVYCNQLDPTKEHVAEHNHQCCEEKGLEARTFYRKDHLRQHLRLMHGCKMTEHMESWKSEVKYIRSRCGFCGEYFDNWQDRADHLAREFRNGAKMKDWKGCRGLDAHVAALVMNAMPPYLIGNEAKSPVPFSASKRVAMNHHNQIGADIGKDLEALIPTVPAAGAEQEMCKLGVMRPPSNYQEGEWSGEWTDARRKATCWEILTIRLGEIVKSMREAGVPVTDEALQREARIILYSDEDPWNQTAADNPEWLELFKKAHGLTPVPEKFDRRDALEDLGMLGDAFVDDKDVLNPNYINNNDLDALNMHPTLAGDFMAAAHNMFDPLPGLNDNMFTSADSSMTNLLPTADDMSFPITEAEAQAFLSEVDIPSLMKEGCTSDGRMQDFMQEGCMQDIVCHPPTSSMPMNLPSTSAELAHMDLFSMGDMPITSMAEDYVPELGLFDMTIGDEMYGNETPGH